MIEPGLARCLRGASISDGTCPSIFHYLPGVFSNSNPRSARESERLERYVKGMIPIWSAVVDMKGDPMLAALGINIFPQELCDFGEALVRGLYKHYVKSNLPQAVSMLTYFIKNDAAHIDLWNKVEKVGPIKFSDTIAEIRYCYRLYALGKEVWQFVVIGVPFCVFVDWPNSE